MKNHSFVTLLALILASCAPAEHAATPVSDFDKWVATQSAKRAECEALDQLAIVNEKALAPGEIVSGPAEIIPDPYLAIIDLSIFLGVDMPAAGGLIITSGNSVQIPQKLVFVTDQSTWVPTGNITIFASDDLMWKHLKCWTAARSP